MQNPNPFPIRKTKSKVRFFSKGARKPSPFLKFNVKTYLSFPFRQLTLIKVLSLSLMVDILHPVIIKKFIHGPEGKCKIPTHFHFERPSPRFGFSLKGLVSPAPYARGFTNSWSRLRDIGDYDKGFDGSSSYGWSGSSDFGGGLCSVWSNEFDWR